jgi:hypothetical protein
MVFFGACAGVLYIMSRPQPPLPPLPEENGAVDR